MNLLLISPPTSKSLPGADFYFRMPTLGLLRVAGATPPEWTVSTLDETAEPIDAHARDPLARMIPYQLEWLGQASTDIARDDEVLDLCRKSGCMGLLIGFETLSRERLQAVRKGFNRPDDYLDAIRKIHDYGIGISGGFVFGLDGDDEGVYDRTPTSPCRRPNRRAPPCLSSPPTPERDCTGSWQTKGASSIRSDPTTTLITWCTGPRG